MKKSVSLACYVGLMIGAFEVNVHADGERSELSHIDASVYPYLHRPERYPDYKFRPTPPPTWKTFNGRMELRTSDSFDMNGQARTIMVRQIVNKNNDERVADVLVDGKVMRVEEETLLPAGNYSKFLKFMNEWDDEGGMLRLAGYKIFRVPEIDKQNFNRMVGMEGSFAGIANDMYGILGDRYLGMQFGESDASYLNLSPYYIFPSPRTKLGNYWPFHDYFADYGDNVGNRVMVHNNNLWHHYTAREGIVTAVEGQNFVRNDGFIRLHNAFMRGAGKQYGVLWSGGFSAETTWGIRQHFSEACQDELKELVAADKKRVTDYSQLPPMDLARRRRNWSGPRCGDLKGAPLSFIRRLFYTLYMNNASHAIWEVSMTHEFVSSDEKISKLSPVGHFYNSISSFMNKHGDPGVMQTPVAMMLDFNAGWRAPRSRNPKLVSRNGVQYYSWPTLKYERGDYLTYNILDVFFPGFINSSKFTSLEYALTDTPYGEICDVLLSDAQLPVLQRYPMLIVGGDLQTDIKYLRGKLEAYVKHGGNLVLTGENARKLFPEWGIVDRGDKLAGGESVEWGDGEELVEPNDLRVLRINAMPEGGKIVAENDGRALLVEVPMGQGMVTVSMTPYGINQRVLPVEKPKLVKKQVGDEVFEEIDRKIGRPFYLAESFKKCLDSKLKDIRLFNLSNDRLAYVTTRKGEGEYWVSVFNDHLNEEPFKIVSQIGEVASIEEIDLEDDWVKQEKGYYPYCYLDNDGGESDEDSIAGGDTRIFKIRLKRELAEVMPDYKPNARPVKRLLALKYLQGLRQKIALWPSFFEEFGGVKVSGQALLDTDFIEQDVKWINRRDVQILVDGRDISHELNILSLIDKMDELETAKVLIVKNVNNSISSYASSKGIAVVPSDVANEKVRLFDRDNASVVDERFEGIVVMNMDYEVWDDIYHDMRVAAGELDEVVVGRDINQGRDAGDMVDAKNAKRMLALRGIDDFKKAVLSQNEFFERFGGVTIEARYLRQSDVRKLIHDKQWADEKGIKLVVDFSSSINGYKDITFHTEMGVIYQRGLKYAENVLQKMNVLGLNDAIFITHGMGGQHKAINDGFVAFCNLAKVYGVDLHLRNSNRLTTNSIDRFMKKFEGRVDNVTLAPSTISERDLSKLLAVEAEPEYVLLSSSTEMARYNTPLPLSVAKGRRQVNIEPLKNVDAYVILDAIYVNDDELADDLALLP
ncbi:hypothetical protein JD969_17605 [Planctomycetota bacterium]|nr:hypothetical protein JD969_17605 [Planctomycetota bacterium]